MSERIGAILSAKDGVVQFLGYGVNAGREVPPADVSPRLNEAGIDNPKLVLDDGSVVWGCECWWGGEESVKAQLAKYDKVEMAKIER